MRYWLDAAAAPEAGAASGVETIALFGAERGCDPFEQRLILVDGSTDERSDPARDEVLYVLAGTGAATVGGDLFDLALARPPSSRAAPPGASTRRTGSGSCRCS